MSTIDDRGGARGPANRSGPPMLIVQYRALSLGDVLLKLELWCQLAGDLWDSRRVIESVVIDLKKLDR